MSKTGVELITEIAKCSEVIEHKKRLGLSFYWEEIRRHELREDMSKLPDIPLMGV